ncbi:MAG: NAD(+)/NADH kinase [Gammaproteobacteria bacterium]|nr:NAD(+)/NADH kinase [Gammaproteobacteria bacterium]
MSGRDVRRLAARATTSTHHDKQLQITRLVLGALEQGVEEVVLIDEPFRISRRAVENLSVKQKLTFIASAITHTANDTVELVEQMRDLGCQVIIVMGGDGTSRIVARTWPDAVILPVSTGTNNVFPKMIEPSVAGAAAGLVATGKLDYQRVASRCKQIHIRTPQRTDLALVDAVLVRDDSLGNMLPFEAHKISTLLLAISEPAAVGMSPIGGFTLPCLPQDDFGVLIHCGEPASYKLRVPISPGLYDDISIRSAEPVALGQEIEIQGPGILAFDGDRELALSPTDRGWLSVKRDGPWVLDARQVLQAAASKKILRR